MAHGKQKLEAIDYVFNSVQISIECQDDQYGLHAEVVYDERSFTLRRCTRLVTEYHGMTQNHNETGEVNRQIRATAGFSTNTNVMGDDDLTFTDGTSFMILGTESQHWNGQELFNRDGRYEKEKAGASKKNEEKTMKGGNKTNSQK